MRLPVGKRHPFRPGAWAEIREFLGRMAELHPGFDHMVAVVDSVFERGAQDQLAACTSMHDLLVVTVPVPDPPYDVIRVCAPSSLRPAPPGMVVVEHQAATGNDERVTRAAADAVPLFWAFVREKYGIPAAYSIEESGT